VADAPIVFWLVVGLLVACIGGVAAVVLWPEIAHRRRQKRYGGWL
jgi:hypothetical protein